MFNMGQSSNTMPQGFYVFQSTVGAPLEFHPTLGTAELDEMIDNYVLGFAPIQDKRATISLDFFEHASLTGESIKFYPCPTYSFASTTSSPASLQDSGYASSFSASPMAPTWNWGQVAQAPSPSFPSAQSALQPRRQSAASARNSTIAAARSRASDFSHLPGMKILTRDGQDVTNAASRGSKTKEQRDHAHLMRIIKACDSCRRKKIRCDPSHKTQEAAKSRSQEASRAPTNTRHTSRKSQSEVPNAISGARSLAPTTPLSEISTLEPVMFDTVHMERWEDMVNMDQNIPTVPDDYDWCNDPKGLFSQPSDLDDQELFSPVSMPVSAFSPSSQQSMPLSPLSQQSPSASISVSASTSPGDVVLPCPNESGTRLPRLPYLDDSGLPHEYIDFNLYSPASSFADDELPVFAGDLSSPTPGDDDHRHKPHSPRHDISRSPAPGEEVYSLLSAQGVQPTSSARQSLQWSAVGESSSQTRSKSSLFAPTEAPSTKQPLEVFTSSSVHHSRSQFKPELAHGGSQHQAHDIQSTAAQDRTFTSLAPVAPTGSRHSSDEESCRATSCDMSARLLATTTTTTPAATTMGITSTRASRLVYATQNGSVNRLSENLHTQAVSSTDVMFDADPVCSDVSRDTSVGGVKQYGFLAPLQMLAMTVIAVFCLRGEKSSLMGASWTKAPQTFLLSLASALAVGVLLHAITARNLLLSDMLSVKESLPGVVLCIFAFLTSRSVGKTVGGGESAGHVAHLYRRRQEAGNVAPA